MGSSNVAEAEPATETSGGSEDQHIASWRLAIVIGSICLGIFLFGLDINIVGTAIPRITTEFHSLSSISWYGSAYLLTVTAFQPLFGNLYKYFNAKFVYLSSLLLFEVGSAVCALAPGSGVLIFGRALLGFGAAGLLQGGLAIIGYVVPLEKVPMFQGVVVSALFISTCVGPVLGGVLTERANWRWCFWINVPIGFVAILVILALIPAKQFANEANSQSPLPEKLKHMDAAGTILFIGAICCLLLGLTWGGQTYEWRDSRVIGLFVGSGFIWACFCYWLWLLADLALIPLRVLRQRSICAGAITLFTLGISNQIYAYFLPIYFQSVQGASTADSGVRYIALAVPLVTALVITGAVVSSWGHYVPYMISGVVIANIGAGFLTTIATSTSTPEWAAFMAITGLGLGMVQQLPYTAVQAVLDPVDIPIGNAIFVFSFQLGGAIGLAVGQNLLLNKLQAAVPEYTRAVSAAQVITAGPTGLTVLATSPTILSALRQAYSDSVRYTTILALAGICLALIPCCSMERVNIKKVAASRR